MMLTIALAMSSLRGSCKIGCLSCETVNSGHECYVCDTKNYYHLVSKPRSLYRFSFASLLKRAERADRDLTEEGGECELFPQCEEVYGRNCAKCAPEFVIKETAKGFGGETKRECEAVRTAVKNCLEYEKDGLCSICQTGFFLHEEVRTLKHSPEDQEQCLQWPKVILKCQTHFKDANNNIRCKECEVGYMLSDKLDRCEEHRDENCLVASNVGCAECGTGYDLQSESLNYVSSHVKDFEFAKNLLIAMRDNRRRAELIECKPKIDYCRKYITISPFDKQRIPDVEMGVKSHLDMGVEESEMNSDGDKLSEDERILWQAAHTQRRLFEVKFGDDDANKWVIGIAPGKGQKTAKSQTLSGVSGEKTQIPIRSDLANHHTLDGKISDQPNVSGHETHNLPNKEPVHNSTSDPDNIHIVTCGRCARGYYLHQVAPLQFECFEAQPIGHCEEYRDRTTCLLCDKNFSLVQNRCEPIEETNFVQNCRYYTDNQECLVCEGDFALLRMKNELGLNTLQEEFEKTHPYMSHNHHVRSFNKKSGQMSDVNGLKGPVVEYEDNEYEVVKQLNITQLIAKETLKEYIEGKRTMDDLKESGERPVHYDLSDLNFEFNEEPVSTVVFERNQTMDDEDIRQQNLEINKQIENSMKDGQGLEVSKVPEKEKVLESGENQLDNGTLVETQVVQKDIVQDDRTDYSEGTHFNVKGLTPGVHDTDDDLETQNNQRTEEDVVVLNVDTQKKGDPERSRARKLMDLFSMFRKSNKKDIPGLDNEKVWLGDRIMKKRKKVTSPKWKMNRLRNKLKHVMGHRRILEGVTRKLEENGSERSRKPLEVSGQNESQVQSGADSNLLDDESYHSGNEADQQTGGGGGGGGSGKKSEVNDLFNPDISPVIETNSTTQSLKFENETENRTQSATQNVTMNEIENRTHSATQAQVNESHSLDMTQADVESSRSDDNSDMHLESQSNGSVEVGSLLQSDISEHTSDVADDHESTSVVQKGVHDNLEQFHDSKHIVMDTPENLNHDQMEKDKEFLDRLFDSEGQGYTDPDKISSQRSKMDLIHNIINQSGVGGTKPTPLTDHLHSSSLNEHKTVQQIIRESGVLTSGKDLTTGQPLGQHQIGGLGAPMKKTGPNTLQMPSKKTLCVILNSIPNCALHLHGKCIQCEEKYYLAGQACKPLSEGKRVSFCSVYNSDQRCIKCREGFQLVSGQCLFFKGVLNCRQQVFYPNGKCLVCKHGHVFSKEQGKCVSRESLYFKSQEEKENHKAESDTGGLLVDQNKEEDLNQFDKNCLLERTNSDKTCYMCRTEYYMNKKGECIFSDINYHSGFFGIF